MITSADQRLNVEQIKRHPFFYGVDWAAIRQIDAPFVPRLSSITDTSYFPTDEIDQVTDDAPDASSADKDLAFLGSVVYSIATAFRFLTRSLLDILSSAFSTAPPIFIYPSFKSPEDTRWFSHVVRIVLETIPLRIETGIRLRRVIIW